MESINSLKYLRVSLTTLCNKQCWYCFREGIPEEKSMMTDVSTFEWLICLLKTEFGLTNIRFTGGEPMLNPCIKDFVRSAKKVEIPSIGITTNGYQLLSQFNELCQAGSTSFAVHYTDIDNEDWSLDSASNEIINDKRVRYNVVVTNQNMDNVLHFIDFCNEKGVSLLLLDLLDTSLADYPHRELYYPLQDIGEHLVLNGYRKIVQNINCVLYVNDSHSIKLVTRYTPDLKQVYCTHKLGMHPVLLTSDFNFRICNHFGSKEIKTQSMIKNKSKEEVICVINSVIQQLTSCQECGSRKELSDH